MKVTQIGNSGNQQIRYSENCPISNLNIDNPEIREIKNSEKLEILRIEKLGSWKIQNSKIVNSKIEGIRNSKKSEIDGRIAKLEISQAGNLINWKFYIWKIKNWETYKVRKLTKKKLAI